MGSKSLFEPPTHLEMEEQTTDTIRLKATTVAKARQEVRQRWPQYDVKLNGLDEHGDCVYISFVHRSTVKAYVATARREGKPVEFHATIVD